MEALNISGFVLINGSPASPAWALVLARLVANYSVLAAALWLIYAWVRRAPKLRPTLILSTLAALSGLGLVQIIATLWYHPRPFEIGLGHQLMPHPADSSFPSDHGTLFFTLAASFLLHPATRRPGLGFALAGLAVAWSRVFLGVHFPLDMLGAAALGLLTAAVFARAPAAWQNGLTTRANTLYEGILNVLHLPPSLFPRAPNP